MSAYEYEDRVKAIWDLYHSIEKPLTAWVYARSGKDSDAQETALDQAANLSFQFLKLTQQYYYEALYPEDNK
jgi:hypothetical protein